MPISVKFTCDGCDASIEGTKKLGRQFVSISGKGWGFGSYQYDMPADVTPDGWIAYDIVGCCYCPECLQAMETEATHANT